MFFDWLINYPINELSVINRRVMDVNTVEVLEAPEKNPC